MSYVHMRIFSVYGPGDHETSLVSQCVKTFAGGGHIDLSSCRQMWNYLYADDCARAAADLAGCVLTSGEDDPGYAPVVNVASEVSRPLAAYVEEIRETLGSGSYTLNGDREAAEGTPWLEPDVSKLRRLTGFAETTGFREGVLRCAGAIRA